MFGALAAIVLLQGLTTRHASKRPGRGNWRHPAARPTIPLAPPRPALSFRSTGGQLAALGGWSSPGRSCSRFPRPCRGCSPC
jgi:hypothetical protein